MSTGRRGGRGPADAIGNAVKVMRILTGEEPEITARRPRRTKPLLNRTALATRR